MSIVEEFQAGIVCSSPEETREKARELASILPENVTLAFHGDLGVGKTTFVSGLAEAWGIPGPVTSPTYNIFNTYRGTVNLLHLDAYRLQSAEEVESLYLDELLTPPYCLAVEWPDNIKSYISPRAWHMHLSIDTAHKHHIKLVLPG